MDLVVSLFSVFLTTVLMFSQTPGKNQYVSHLIIEDENHDLIFFKHDNSSASFIFGLFHIKLTNFEKCHKTGIYQEANVLSEKTYFIFLKAYFSDINKQKYNVRTKSNMCCINNYHKVLHFTPFCLLVLNNGE